MVDERIVVKADFTPYHIWCLLFWILGGLCFPASFIIADATNGSVAKGMMPTGFLIILLGVGLIATGVILSRRQYEFVVTSTKVVGKTLLGKRVDLPISQISTVGSGIFKRITVATSSGHISFYGVINQSEVFRAVSELVNERHVATQVSVSSSQGEVVDFADQLLKLNQLLEKGVITQEEFDAKKKQLLGL